MKEWLKMKDRNVKIKSFFVFSSKILCDYTYIYQDI